MWHVFDYCCCPEIFGAFSGKYKNFNLWIISVIVVSLVSGDCPSNVQQQAFDCFGDFHTQLINMQKSRATLFSGVDVEILRAFCSSYNKAMNCVNSFKAECPESLHRRIDITLSNLKGARNELAELCGDDKLYEIYARHMTCFQNSGSYSERCFENIMNTTIRLMKRIDDKRLDELCRDLTRTLNCIRENIKRNCGPEASSLVHTLVKPMVRRSMKCDENGLQASQGIGKKVSTSTATYHNRPNGTPYIIRGSREKVPTSTTRYRIQSAGTPYIIRVRTDDVDDRNSSILTRTSNMLAIVCLLCLVISL